MGPGRCFGHRPVRLRWRQCQATSSLEHFQRAELFLTFFAAQIDFDRGEITWSGAGHPGPLLLSRQGNPQQLLSQNLPLGLDLPDTPDIRQDRMPVQSGARLFFFTDGLYEVADARGRQLGLDGFRKLAQSTMGYDLFVSPTAGRNLSIMRTEAPVRRTGAGTRNERRS